MLSLFAAATVALGAPVSDTELAGMRGGRMSAWGQYERMRLAEERIIEVRLEQIDGWWAIDGASLIADFDRGAAGKFALRVVSPPFQRRGLMPLTI